MASSRKDHDLLIRVEQKLDDLSGMVKDHVGKEDAVMVAVPKLSESVKWMSRAIIGAYTAILTAVAGAIAAYVTK